jgi:hypothetical protein
MCRILLAAARCEAISPRFGRGLRTCSSEASRRTKRMFSAMLPERITRSRGTRANCGLRLTGSSVARAVAAKRVASKFVSSESFCVTASASKAGMVRTAPRCKRHRGREIVLDTEEASVRRDRLHGPDQQDWRWFVAHGTLRCRHIILTKPLKGCSQLKSWAMRIASRAGIKAKVGLARRLAVIMHRMLAEGAPFNAAAV